MLKCPECDGSKYYLPYEGASVHWEDGRLKTREEQKKVCNLCNEEGLLDETKEHEFFDDMLVCYDEKGWYMKEYFKLRFPLNKE